MGVKLLVAHTSPVPLVDPLPVLVVPLSFAWGAIEGAGSGAGSQQDHEHQG